MLRLLHLCLFVLEEDSTGLDSNTAEHFSDTCNASCLSCHFYNQATTEMIVCNNQKIDILQLGRPYNR